MKSKTEKYSKITFNKTFLIFSGILFVVIACGTIAAYLLSARQINRSFIEQQLSIASETMRLRLATTVNSELALVLKMADTPVIRQYFMNPSDPVLKAQANIEFALYREHFNNKMIFWVSDADKIFYSTESAPYLINPDDPDSYWYKLTLYETEKFNFNINYNPDLDQIYLWVNVPVFVESDAGKKPVGLLGIGINLTDFSDFVASSHRKFDENITPYMFNKYHEITAAVDYELVQNKVRLDDLLGETGKELIRAAHELSEGENRIFAYGKRLYLVNSIPSMEWYFAVSYPLPGLLALNRAMNTEFFGMLLLILFLFIVINVFIARSENAMAKQNLQLLEANQKAQAASQAKSDFLAKMSHEIRTPMNAITGMAELLLRGELSGKSRGQVQDIKQAGANLLSIINDILDFSKIESGKLEIVPVKYLLSSLINDTVNIIRTRLIEKPIRFFTNIDGAIPNSLTGDEARLRQIMLNLLSNAVKYSEKGYIGLTVTTDKRDSKHIWLKIAVIDTGKGIKPEDQAKLFSDFVQVDTRKNQNIEGTGLGLAIAKRLCIAMGGDITMKSEYGMGSVFTAQLPQGIESEEPFAGVQEPEQKKILVYEGRAVYAKSVCWTLENLKVPYTMVTNRDDFEAALSREQWTNIFSGYGLYTMIKMSMDRVQFPEGKKPPLALMIEWGTEAFIPDVRFISIPVQSLSISNVLNGKADSKDYVKASAVIRFCFPGARLLVVDDIATNLQIAEGLLAPYNTVIDTCLSGAKAIELVKQHEYDIIFMDHMMPEMDGIEATAAIRALDGSRFRTMPIIALTANAVTGMREMFLQNGFNDFLSKPIDVTKLDDMLGKWIPKEKRAQITERKNIASAQSASQTASASQANVPLSLPPIPNVDIKKGISLTGGTIAAYTKVLTLFCKDVESRLPLLRKAPDDAALPLFITQVHSLKSASASIGAQEVSSIAAGLEAIGKAGDTEFIRESLPDFTEKLEELTENIRAALEADKETSPQDTGYDMDIKPYIPLFRELAAALKAQNVSEIERVLEELNNKPMDSRAKKILEKVSDDMLITEFDHAFKKIISIIDERGR
jgi:signal transduction histidine kinase/CheY-like chemotaxis protein